MTFPRKFAAVLTTLVLVAGGSLLAAGPASATVHSGTSNFTFSSFVADYYLGKDLAGHSTLRTVERLTAVFPQSNQNKGIVRSIPDTYRGSSLHTKFVSISDSNGVTKPYSVDDDGTVTTVSAGTDAYVHGPVTYTITYTQQNVAGAFANTNDQEFYWDTNGVAWDQPFASVTARVHVDPSLVPSLLGHNACYRGAQGSKDTCTIVAPPLDTATPGATATPAATEALFTASTGSLPAHQNMTVAIAFADGTFTDAPSGTDAGIDSGTVTPPAQSAWVDILGLVLLIASVLAIIAALVGRFAFGPRNDKGRGIIIAEYDVPVGLNLIEAGSLVNRASTSVAAQIVSFAVRGNLRILDYPVTDSGAKFTLELSNAAGLDAEESQLMSALFPTMQPGAVREMVADSSLAAALAALTSGATTDLIGKGWRAKASFRPGWMIALAALGLLVIDVIAFFVSSVLALENDILFGAGFAAFIALIVGFLLANRGTVITAEGAEKRDYLLGMQVYLKLAEEDRMRMLQSPTGAERVNYGDKREVVKLYEKLLPFAVLFGVENEWSKQLAVRYQDTGVAPGWYVSTSAFNSVLFAASLSTLASSTISSVTPVAVSSGGSSFGGGFGGGFSGGGGGGGGGGGR